MFSRINSDFQVALVSFSCAQVSVIYLSLFWIWSFSSHIVQKWRNEKIKNENLTCKTCTIYFSILQNLNNALLFAVVMDVVVVFFSLMKTYFTAKLQLLISNQKKKKLKKIGTAFVAWEAREKKENNLSSCFMHEYTRTHMSGLCVCVCVCVCVYIYLSQR